MTPLASRRLKRLTDDLETIADWRDELQDQMRYAWVMTPRQFDRLECGLAAFAAFTRLCAPQQERQQDRRAA